jgi:hypothetical protein
MSLVSSFQSAKNSVPVSCPQKEKSWTGNPGHVQPSSKKQKPNVGWLLVVAGRQRD